MGITDTTNQKKLGYVEKKTGVCWDENWGTG